MSEAKIKAEAILIVIKRILKWIGILIAVIAILFFLAFQYEEYERKKKELIEEKVSIKAFHSKAGSCSKDFPYQYFILNESGKTVEKVTFTIAIKRVGFSSEINRYTSLEEDKIILNNESYGRCFRALVAGSFTEYLNESDVNIEIKYKSVRFKK
jgi:hypothetical protein